MGVLTLSLDWRLAEGAEEGLPEQLHPSTSEFRPVSWAEDVARESALFRSTLGHPTSAEGCLAPAD